jgi:lysozyme
MAQMNDGGIALLKKCEGCVLHAYDDANKKPVNPGTPIHGKLTIGYGHTGNDVFPGLAWTKEQADHALQNDVAAVSSEITPLITAGLSDNQFSAFVCLAFNIGAHAFAGSSALHLANQKDFANVPTHIMLWDKTTINGRLVVSLGLQHRRGAEVVLWNTASVLRASNPPKVATPRA